MPTLQKRPLRGHCGQTLATALIVLIVVSGRPPPAHAQGKPGENKVDRSDARAPEAAPGKIDPHAALAERWNVDQDNVYTCEEWRYFMKGVFLKADKNHDGFIAMNEFPAVNAVDRIFASASLAYFDSNNDGRLVSSELVDLQNPIFLLHDKDKDCKVTREQLLGGSGSSQENKGGRSGRERK